MTTVTTQADGKASYATHSASRRQTVSNLGWTTVSQSFSAASNFIIAVLVGRQLGASGLGSFALAFSVYNAALIFARALISEPMSAARHALAGPDRSAATTLTVMVAAVSSGMSAALGLLLSEPVLLALAAFLPLTLLQDLLRFQSFSLARPRLAVVSDASWFLGTLLAWPALIASPTPEMATAMWAGAAGFGLIAIYSALQPRLVTPATAIRWWKAECQALARPLMMDSALQVVTIQTTAWTLVVMTGDEGLGTFRASQIYFFPITILLTAFGCFAVPHLAKRSAELPSGLATIRMSCILATTALPVCAVIVLAEPLLRDLLYGGAVAVPPSVLVGSGTLLVLAAYGNGLAAVCKVRRRARDIAFSRVVSSLAGLPLVVAATHQMGIAGAVWAGVAASAVYGALLTRRVLL
ncbi:MAG: hypothetical protein ACT4P1_00625 [Sporichthyaceae bacterium]